MSDKGGNKSTPMDEAAKERIMENECMSTRRMMARPLIGQRQLKSAADKNESQK